MKKTLTELADSIGASHAAVDEVEEFVDERGGPHAKWRVGLTDMPPQTMYDNSEQDDDSLFAMELPDVSSARYALRELLQRGFAGEHDDDSPDGTYLYAHPIDEN